VASKTWSHLLSSNRDQMSRVREEAGKKGVLEALSPLHQRSLSKLWPALFVACPCLLRLPERRAGNETGRSPSSARNRKRKGPRHVRTSRRCFGSSRLRPPERGRLPETLQAKKHQRPEAPQVKGDGLKKKHDGLHGPLREAPSSAVIAPDPDQGDERKKDRPSPLNRRG